MAFARSLPSSDCRALMSGTRTCACSLTCSTSGISMALPGTGVEQHGMQPEEQRVEREADGGIAPADFGGDEAVAPLSNSEEGDVRGDGGEALPVLAQRLGLAPVHEHRAERG